MKNRFKQFGGMMLLLGLLCLPGLLAAQENRLALVIGNSNYKESPLTNPLNDASDMAGVLKDLGFTVILRTDANRREMAKAIREFGRELKRKRGVGLFYYAGHGMQIDNRNFLIPIDTPLEEEDEVPYESVDVGSVLAKMESAGNSLNLLILDACRNNPFPSQFRSSTRGLARVEAPVGSLVVYATAPGNVAADGKGRNGVFTGALLEQLKQRGLSLTQTIRRTRAAVVKATGGQQVPWASSSLLQDYYFHESSPNANGEPDTTQENNASPALAAIPVAEKSKPTSKSDNKHASEDTQLALLDTTIEKANIPDKPPSTTRGSLTVNVEPETARIRIMNIVEKYAPGMLLDRSRSYDVYVTKPGYESFREMITLDKQSNQISVVLPQRHTAAPITVPIPGGEFAMGCSIKDSLCEPYEKPRHTVTVPPFSITRTEITVAEFNLFVSATGYRTDAQNNAGGYTGCYVWSDGGGISRASAKWIWSKGKNWRDPGYEQNANYPVSCVSWNDANAYAQWLSQSTNQQYSLPTEAEWEFAARAGAITAFGLSDDPNAICKHANVADLTRSPKGAKWSNRISCSDKYWFSAPVASFKANRLGVHDMQGNVWEWVEDMWVGHYNNTPTNGTAYLAGKSEERVLRGGAWESDEGRVRLSSRSKATRSSRTAMTGFRLVVR